MKPLRILTGTASALTSLAVALTGAVVLTAAPAQAAVTVTDYAFRTSAFGTKVTGAGIGVYSGRTAHSFIACTRRAGLNESNSRNAYETMAEIRLPADNPTVYVGAGVSRSSTFREKGRTGTRSTHSIPNVDLGPIRIAGLTTTAQAWADRRGKLHARSSAVGGVTLTGATGTPLDDVLGEISKPLSTLLDNIPADGLVVPGLGKMTVNRTRVRVGRLAAYATARSLRVELENPADTTITIGRSHAEIMKGLPAGVFGGGAWALEIPSALGGVAKIGRIGNRPMPCPGTYGEVRSTRGVLLDPGGTGQLRLGALTGQVYGVQNDDGSARGWTEGRVAGITLGPLQLEGIVGRANVRQARSGKVRSSISGSKVGAMYVDGERQGEIPDPGEPICIGQGDQCAMRVTFFDKTKLERGVRVTAVRIEVLALEGLPAGTVIELGNARAVVHRS